MDWELTRTNQFNFKRKHGRQRKEKDQTARPARKRALAKYVSEGLDIQRDVCDRCPAKCMEWNGKKLSINNGECVRFMHCINVMTKALRPGKEKGAVLLLDAKAPILQGALLSSVLVPFVPAEELLETVRELTRRVWEFWDDYGNNRI